MSFEDRFYNGCILRPTICKKTKLLVWARLVHNCLSLNAFICPIALFFKVLYSTPASMLVDKSKLIYLFFTLTKVFKDHVRTE